MHHSIEAEFAKPPKKRSGKVKAALSSVLISSLLVGTARADDILPKTIDRPAMASSPAERKRTYLLGDSIVWDECSLLKGFVCSAFPGGWTSGPDGKDILAQLIDKAGIHTGDTVILSNISAWTSDGTNKVPANITNEVVIDRLRQDYGRLKNLGAHVILMIAPDPFPMCIPTNFSDLPSDQQTYFKPEKHWKAACETQAAIRAEEMTWDSPHIIIPGPYNAEDGVHPTPGVGGGQEVLANILLAGSINGWDTVTS